jgi:uncharacterized protein (TIGR02246 family)
MQNAPRAACIAIFATAIACSSSPQVVQQGTMSDANRAAIADTIEGLSNAAFAAGNAKNLDSLFAFFSPQTSFLSVGEIVQSWPEHQKEAKAFFATLRSVKFEPLDYKVEVLTPDVALWRGTYRHTFTDSAGKATSGTSAQTWVWVREGSTWLIRHVHVSDPPLKTASRSK